MRAHARSMKELCMKISQNWKDYSIIATGDGYKLERWKDVTLLRPDPQVIWSGERKDPRWRNAHAIYHRSNSGGGYWETLKKVPDVWSINYNIVSCYTNDV